MKTPPLFVVLSLWLLCLLLFTSTVRAVEATGSTGEAEDRSKP